MILSNCTVTTHAIAPGWKVGYLVRETNEACDYRVLPVVSIAEVPNGLEPVVMTPDGRTVRASEVGATVFAVGPDESAEKIAQAHAASRGRTEIGLAA